MVSHVLFIVVDSGIVVSSSVIPAIWRSPSAHPFTVKLRVLIGVGLLNRRVRVSLLMSFGVCVLLFQPTVWLLASDVMLLVRG